MYFLVEIKSTPSLIYRVKCSFGYRVFNSSVGREMHWHVRQNLAFYHNYATVGSSYCFFAIAMLLKCIPFALWFYRFDNCDISLNIEVIKAKNQDNSKIPNVVCNTVQKFWHNWLLYLLLTLVFVKIGCIYLMQFEIL